LDKDKFLFGGLDSKVSVISLLTIHYFHLTFTSPGAGIRRDEAHAQQLLGMSSPGSILELQRRCSQT
jgi:hypothetical protein